MFLASGQATTHHHCMTPSPLVLCWCDSRAPAKSWQCCLWPGAWWIARTDGAPGDPWHQPVEQSRPVLLTSSCSRGSSTSSATTTGQLSLLKVHLKNRCCFPKESTAGSRAPMACISRAPWQGPAKRFSRKNSERSVALHQLRWIQPVGRSEQHALHSRQHASCWRQSQWAAARH